MDEENLKEVYFDQYCPTCEYESYRESDDPCWDCLNEPARANSHKPLKHKEKKKC